jgi:hypothetical protein
MQASVTASAIATVRATTSRLAPVPSSAKFFSVSSRTTWPLKWSKPKKLLASSASSEPTYTTPTQSSGGTSSSSTSSALRR